ncbi:MAG TPA: hypothetical protein VGW33_06140 [Terriglobia bacterium]|nr:hypothetical protein [Terriglobia bacterium]
MKSLKVYIDTNVLKFSAIRLPRPRPREQEINGWGRVHKVTVHEPVDVNPNDFIKDPGLKAEVELLPELAEAGKRGQLRYVMQMETRIEGWGIPNMDSATGLFYGAPIRACDAPIKYSRMIAGGIEGPKNMQFEFLTRISSKRFLELQKLTGVYQGKGNLNRNQLLDAFHLWCAEHSKCDYFLTLDFKLIGLLQGNFKSQLQVKALRPSALLSVVKVSI